jgi:hypothetical protein
MKDEVKSKILKQVLGNKRGVNVYISKEKLATNSVICNWTGPITPPSNAPMETFWFAFVDSDPNANWEHPVEYLFVNDKTGEVETVRGTTPPTDIDSLDKIQ